MANPTLEYDEAVMEQLFRRGDWRNWDDCINWLKDAAYSAGSLPANHIKSLTAHLCRLKEDNVPFPLDYREAFKLVQQHCKPRLS